MSSDPMPTKGDKDKPQGLNRNTCQEVGATGFTDSVPQSQLQPSLLIVTPEQVRPYAKAASRKHLVK